MPLKAYQLKDKFRPFAKLWGGISLFRPDMALTMLDEAEVNGLVLLGFDGFRLIGDLIQPDQLESWDYSSGPGAKEKAPYAHARQFIGRRANTELWFEIVLADRISAL